MAKIAKDTIVGVIKSAADLAFTGAQDITLSGPQVATQEVTSHGTAFTREYIAGLQDNGELSLTVYPNEADMANTNTAIGYVRSVLRTSLTFFIEQIGGLRYEFSGIVTDLSETHPVDGVFSANVTVKVTGAFTITT